MKDKITIKFDFKKEELQCAVRYSSIRSTYTTYIALQDKIPERERPTTSQGDDYIWTIYCFCAVENLLKIDGFFFGTSGLTLVDSLSKEVSSDKRI